MPPAVPASAPSDCPPGDRPRWSRPRRARAATLASATDFGREINRNGCGLHGRPPRVQRGPLLRRAALDGVRTPRRGVKRGSSLKLAPIWRKRIGDRVWPARAGGRDGAAFAEGLLTPYSVGERRRQPDARPRTMGIFGARRAPCSRRTWWRAVGPSRRKGFPSVERGCRWPWAMAAPATWAVDDPSD